MAAKKYGVISIARRVYGKVHWNYSEKEKQLIWYRAWLMKRMRRYHTRFLVSLAGAVIVFAMTFALRPPHFEARLLGSLFALVGLSRSIRFARRSHRHWRQIKELEYGDPSFWHEFFVYISKSEQEVEEGDPEIQIEVILNESDLQ